VTSPLISEDRRGAFLFEKRGNLKQTVPQRRKKYVVLKVREGNDYLFQPSGGKKKRKKEEEEEEEEAYSQQICKSCKEKFWQTPQE